MTVSQNKRILAHLMTKGSITPMEAISEYGITRLSARIWDLRRDGIGIGMVMEKGVNRWGGKVEFAKYFLTGGPNG